MHIELTYRDIIFPEKIDIEPIKDVYCGPNYTVYLAHSGRLYFFGCNYNRINNSPTKLFNQLEINLPNDEEIDFVSCNDKYIIIKTLNDTFYRVILDRDNIKNNINKWKCIKPIIENIEYPKNVMSINGELLLTDEECLYEYDKNTKNWVMNEELPGITKIGNYFNNNYLLDINHNVWRQCKYKKFECISNTNNKLSNILDIYCTKSTMYLKTIDNKIFAFGKNDNNQINKEIFNQQYYTSREAVQIFKGHEDIWYIPPYFSKQKSARK